MHRKPGQLTEQERAFAAAYAATGDKAEAAKRAGYAHPRANAPLIAARPAVMAEFARLQEERITNQLLPLAVDCLAEIMGNPKAPAGARVSAAKVVIDHALGDSEGRTKEIHEMSREEIDAAISKLSREASERARPVIELEAEPPGEGVFE